MGSFTPNGLYKPTPLENNVGVLLNANWDILEAHIAAGGGGGGGAPTTATYVTLTADAGLSAEAVLGSAVLMAGVLGSRPAAATAGKYYFATDDNGGTLYRDNGATWDQISPSLALTIPNDISPPQITANQDNYAPTGFAGATVLRLDLDNNRTITGLAGGVDGKIVMLINTTTTRTLTLAHESASSTAANRFLAPNAQDLTVQPLCTAMLWYDSTSSRWRIVGIARHFGSAIATVGTANNGGISPNMARDDHVHQTRAHDHSNAADGQSVAPATTFLLPSFITPAQITANQNDYAPTGIATATVLRLTSDAAGRQITGIAASQVEGRILVLRNVGAFNITLVHDATSTAANRFTLNNAANMQLVPGAAIALMYDGTVSRWSVLEPLAIAATAPSSVGSANSAGTSGLVAARDHVHDHAAQTVATQHAAMVASGASHAPGFVPDPPASSGTTKFLREDATWAVPAGGSAAHFGIVRNFDPQLATQAVAAWVGVNRAKYSRVYGAATITGVQIVVGTASGNISIATYSSTGSGTAARPQTRQQTSGAIACPASGVATVTLTSNAVAEGDWFGMSCDNTTATFQRTTAVSVTAILNGFLHSEAAAHPLPATATPAAPAADALMPLMVGS